jgi:hypothetical protein
MCSKCTEFDNRIARYKKMAVHFTDQITSDGIAGLIKQLMDEMIALHPETEKK